MLGGLDYRTIAAATHRALRAGGWDYDDSGLYPNRNAIARIERNVSAPSGIVANVFNIAQGKGDNATFIGVSGGYFQARDRTDVTALNKGVLYGLQLSVVPRVARNNVPFDDVAGLVVQNDAEGLYKGTDAIYVGRNSTYFPGTNPEWITGVLVSANVDYAYRYDGKGLYGIDLASATISAQAIRLPNASSIGAMNAAGNADLTLLSADSSNRLSLYNGAVTLTSAGQMVLSQNASSLWLGVAPSGNVTFRIGSNITGATDWIGTYGAQEIQSDVTSGVSMFATGPSTHAAAFTLTTLRHYLATQGTLGAGSAVTTQIGFMANSTLTGAVNNFGFYSDIASAANRWNFYASGTADNFFEGIIKHGATAAAANNAQTVTVGNVGPGAGAVSIQSWMKVKDNAGNTRYIPLFG